MFSLYSRVPTDLGKGFGPTDAHNGLVNLYTIPAKNIVNIVETLLHLLCIELFLKF